jgi:hypothetical protein
VGVSEDDDDVATNTESGIVSSSSPSLSSVYASSPSFVCGGHSPVPSLLPDPSTSSSTLMDDRSPSLCSSPEIRSSPASRDGIRYHHHHRIRNFDRDVEETLRLSRHDNPVVQKKLA